MLQNSLACFLAQSYENKYLLILDDADQFDNQESDEGKWALGSLPNRFYESLPFKFNAMLNAAKDEFQADIIAIWEDDDIYLPQHLENIAAMYEGGVQFFAPKEVYSTYNQPLGQVQREGASGRFHASWAYTTGLLNKVDGYPITERLDFDQQMHRKCWHACNSASSCYDQFHGVGPSYVYRWGNPTYHGSQAGEEGYRRLWDELGRRPAPRVGKLEPLMDRETQLIYESYAKTPTES